jgi:hypothetical protein
MRKIFVLSVIHIEEYFKEKLQDSIISLFNAMCRFLEVTLFRERERDDKLALDHYIELIHKPIYALHKIQLMARIKLLDVSAPGCHPQGVI